jgi:hypothetical protein
MKDRARAANLLQSGIIFSAISFLTGIGNLAFQGVMGRHLKDVGDYGAANSALGGLMTLLGLLPSAATFAITHYIAHFNFSGDHARLQGLLLGCRKILFRLTVAGSALAIILVKPLSVFFHFSESLMLVTLLCALLGLWVSLATALGQGLGWFKRLALIGFLAMVFRVGFGWVVTFRWPSAETAVLASAFATLAYWVLLFWKKDFLLRGQAASPWNRELGYYLAVSAAFVVGNFCFFQGDWLVASKFFSKGQQDSYAAAGVLARALPMVVSPLLTVLFTSRSGQRTGEAVTEQFKLVGLYAFGLVFGAVCLFIMRAFCLKLLNKYSPEASAMVEPFAVTMVFTGLLQSLATWGLASRWSKVSILYGGLGIFYWLALFCSGKTPEILLRTMPIAACVAFAILMTVWSIAARRHRAVG